MFIIPLQTIFWRNYYILASFCYPVDISKTKKNKKKYSCISAGSIRSWDFWARYGLQVRYFWYRYFDMMSYDNLIFNISVWYFQYWCFDVGFRSRFGGNYHVKLSKYWEYFQHRIFDYMIVLIFEFGHNITILKMAIFDKVDYIDIEPALSRMQCHFFSSTLTGLWSRFIPRFVQ